MTTDNSGTPRAAAGRPQDADEDRILATQDHDDRDPAVLEGVIRRALELDREVSVTLNEVTEFTNVNYIYKVRITGSPRAPERLILKVAGARLKRVDAAVPRGRVLYEAEALRRFADLCGPTLLIPRVLFIDCEHFAVGMTDVGEGRQVLVRLLERGQLPGNLAEPLGHAIGRVHQRSQGMAPLRAPEDESLLRTFVYGGLLAPAAHVLFPECWDEVLERFLAHECCLIHADLWDKNMLVGDGLLPALVDFEGAFIGDPAFDIASVLAAHVIPVLERRISATAYAGFVHQLDRAYAAGSEDESWAARIFVRAFGYVGTCIAVRVFGASQYAVSAGARERLAELAQRLTRDPSPDVSSYVRDVDRCS